MSIVSQLALAQEYMTRYGMTTYVILGNVGLLFNIAIFSQPHHRRNSSSLYLLAASVCAFLGLNVSAIPIIYQLDHPNATMISQLYCQLQFYVRQALNLLLRIFFLFACADRYALLSENIRIRSFSQCKIAIRVIPCVIIVFLVLGILPMNLQASENGRCGSRSGIHAIINSIYVLIVVGIFPMGSATMFSILIRLNLKKIRSRIQPITNMNSLGNPLINQVLRKRDRDMLKMLLVEIFCYTVTTFPTVAILLYTSMSQTIVKSIDRLRIEAFVIFLTMVFILFGSNGMSFWIYICSSQSFRLEVKTWIIRCYRRITSKAVLVNEVK